MAERDTHSLLLLSIGPVQEFIASARRCRDLWYGSWLLGELAKAAVTAIVDTLGAGAGADDALIFPGALAKSAAGGVEAHGSVANRVLVRVPGSIDDAVDVAAAAEGAVRQRLEELSGAAFALGALASAAASVVASAAALGALVLAFGLTSRTFTSTP